MQHSPAEKFATVLHESCVGVRVARLHRYTARRFDRELRQLDMTMPQLEILSLLVLRKAPVRPGEIADILLTERSTVSRGLSILNDRGWIMATETSPTGRSMAVTITPAGLESFAAAHAAWEAAHLSLTEALGLDAQGVLDTWLERLLDVPPVTATGSTAAHTGPADADRRND